MKKLLLTLVVAIAGVCQVKAQIGAHRAPAQQTTPWQSAQPTGGGLFGADGLFGRSSPMGGGGFGPTYTAGVGVATTVVKGEQNQDGTQNITTSGGAGSQQNVQAGFQQGQTQTLTGASSASGQ